VARSRLTTLRAITESLIENVTAFEIPHTVPARPLLKAGWRQGEGLCCEEVVSIDREEVNWLLNFCGIHPLVMYPVSYYTWPMCAVFSLHGARFGSADICWHSSI
jgi:hypothetical protein